MVKGPRNRGLSFPYFLHLITHFQGDTLIITLSPTRLITSWKYECYRYRLTLIKSVLGSLPTYFFSLFKAPSGVIDALEKLRCKFLWGGGDNKARIQWMDWTKVVAVKTNGGLGVGTLKAQNISLLIKRMWWLKNECIWLRVISNIPNIGSIWYAVDRVCSTLLNDSVPVSLFDKGLLSSNLVQYSCSVLDNCPILSVVRGCLISL